MVNKARAYRLDTHKFYARPHHFKKRLDSLIHRFKNVIGAFGEPFHDKKCQQQIDESYCRISKPIVVSLTGDESQKFDLGCFVIHEADEWATVYDPFSPEIFERSGLYISVCYVKVKDTGATGKETVQGIIEYVTNCLSQCSTDKKLFESLFVFCELSENCSESEITSFREYINGCLSQKSSQWPGMSRIVLGPDHVTLGSIISDYIEKNLLETFHLIYEYLDRFMYKQKSQSDFHGDLAHAKDVEDALFNFVRDAIELADLRQLLITLEEDTRTEKAKFVDDVIDFLAKKLKCILVGPLSVKLGLKRDVCHTCLNVIRFDKIVRKHLSSSTKIDLNKLYEFSNGYEEKIEKVKKEGHKLYKGNDYMIPRLQNDMSAALNEVETELKKAVKQISIMGKMKFEIEGYFRLAGEPIGESQAKLHADLQTDLLKITGVVGVGTIYGNLEIHIKDKEQTRYAYSKVDIDDVIKKHRYSKPYMIRDVVKEAQQLANVQHEHGNPIKSSLNGQTSYREGTLGIFAEGQFNNSPGAKRLYALTCAHVVDPKKMPECPVYVYGNRRSLKKLGVSKPELTVTTGSEPGAWLIDIAAVLVEPEVQRDCLKNVKNEDGFYAPSFVQDSSLQNLEKMNVYKFGANSGLTQGLVCSYDYLSKLNTNCGTDYIIVIDVLPDTNMNTRNSFAKPGDSGSIVCSPSIDKDRPVGSMAVLAMVHAGELQLEGFDSKLCLAFQYSKGIETLRKRSGLLLETQ